jgi:hypothetical protein
LFCRLIKHGQQYFDKGTEYQISRAADSVSDQTCRKAAALVSGLLLTAGLAEAHHGWTEFDEKAEVTDFHYVNPHCVVEFEVKDETGHVHKWQCEFSYPGVLLRRGDGMPLRRRLGTS